MWSLTDLVLAFGFSCIFLFSLIGRAPAQEAGGRGFKPHRRLRFLNERRERKVQLHPVLIRCNWDAAPFTFPSHAWAVTRQISYMSSIVPALASLPSSCVYASNCLDGRKPAHLYLTCATTLQPTARSLELSPCPRSWQKLDAHIQTSIRPSGNQGPSDCCSTLQSDALPTGL